jgi:hypothetical protein
MLSIAANRGESVMRPRTSLVRLVVLIWEKNCGQDLGKATDVIVPKVELNVFGGFSRSVPVGGWANGMPLKRSMLPEEVPTIVPLAIVTVGAARFSRGAARARAVSREIINKYMIKNYA